MRTAARARRAVAALVAVAVVAALALAGCGEPESKKPKETKSTPGEDGIITVAFVPKNDDATHFRAMHRGGKTTGFNQGFVWVYRAPDTTDPIEQKEVVRKLIDQRIDVLIVAPNDPESMAPVLKEAEQQGIRVATAGTDIPDSVRDVFINQVTTKAMGRELTDQLMQAMGVKGRYAIVSCEEDSPKLNSWIKVQKAYTKKKYPKARLVDVVYAGRDREFAVTQAKELMREHPKLTGLVGECPTSAPAVAKAVRESGKIGTVHTVGVGAPHAMTPYLRDGSAAASVIWDARRFGSLTGWAGKQLAEHEQFRETNRVNRVLTDIRYYRDRQMLLLGEPLVLTEKNVESYPPF